MINLKNYKNKNVAVLGLGKAGMSTVRALSASGANIFVWDDGDKARDALTAAALAGVKIAKPEGYNWSEMAALIMSPGIPLTHPEPHPIVALAKAGNCPIICDVELLYEAQKSSKFIGITGTNGKSTTTALTGHILKNAEVKSAVGGNIGIPVLDLDELNDGVYVVEMSSYQLDLIKNTHFNISILLNLTPDHLDRHGDMQGYIAAKEHIYDKQNSSDVAIIGVDDDFSLALYNKLKNQGKIGKVVPISVEKQLPDGISVISGVVYDNLSGEKYPLGYLKRLAGKHNEQNIAAAFAAAKFSGVKSVDIIKAVQSFEGLPHRMQYIAEIDGVTFINDSKATNAEAAAKALVTFDNIYWIAGGMPKEGGISSLGEFFPKIRHAYLIGAAEDEFAATLQGKVEFSKCETLAKAFDAAKNDAMKNGDSKPVVLLSPACASFDQWPNFEVRGYAFCDMVESISAKAQECKSAKV
jgi:UDP-N-acetylmuramoylalanine--D-glutamate ligase